MPFRPRRRRSLCRWRAAPKDSRGEVAPAAIGVTVRDITDVVRNDHMTANAIRAPTVRIQLFCFMDWAVLFLKYLLVYIERLQMLNACIKLTAMFISESAVFSRKLIDTRTKVYRLVN